MYNPNPGHRSFSNIFQTFGSKDKAWQVQISRYSR